MLIPLQFVSAHYTVDGVVEKRTVIEITEKTHYPVQAKAESLPEMAERIALEVGISTTTLFNLVECESNWNPSARSKSGDIGLVQINPMYHPVTEEQALDPEFSLRFAAEAIKEGKAHQWTCCSCVSTARLKVPLLPRQNAEDFISNSNMKDGEVLILDYNGTRHLANKEKITNDGIYVFEGNKVPCSIGTRLITWKELESTLVGFYTPPPHYTLKGG